MVATGKNNGELRICLDAPELNEHIMREHYQAPTKEEVTAQMSGAKVFSKLEASTAFWHFKLRPVLT